MKNKYPLLAAVVLTISACQSSEVVKQNLPATQERLTFREAFYSTEIDGLEHVGSINRVYFTEYINQTGDVTEYRRKFMNDGSSKGFLRKTNAYELAWAASITAQMKGPKATRIKGFENFDTEVLPRLQLPKYYDARMKSPQFKVTQISRFKAWWAITHSLEGEYLEKQLINQEQLSQFNSSSGISADSVRVYTTETVEGRKCLKYSVHYLGDEPLNLMILEQHKVALQQKAKELIGYDFSRTESKIQHDIWVEPETGSLCREREYRYQDNFLTHKESGATKIFKSTRAVEHLYEYKTGETDQ